MSDIAWVLTGFALVHGSLVAYGWTLRRRLVRVRDDAEVQR